ncbi:MAG: SRPBCC family protein [Sphingomonadales bacterium]|nr:SRPBCC family protein [Sphingomonadales bacterium]
MDEGEQRRTWASGWRRVTAAVALALVIALGGYGLIAAMDPDRGLVSVTFLLILPAAICALACYVADPWAQRRMGAYLLMPVWLLLAVIVASGFILHEGVVCVLMLSPLWLISGMGGAALTHRLRRRLDGKGRAYCSALLVLPLVAMQVEPMLPVPQEERAVVRSIVIDAPPQAIWPLLRGIPDVKPGEGAWNFSQDLAGIPRPLGASLFGEGVGAERRANWGGQVRFRERITEWQPGSRIGWRFIFDDLDGWRFTDRHMVPDSPYFRVTRGGYTLEPLPGGRSRLTLDTHYWMKTHLNGYAALWGEVFLGDLHANLLALVKQRAERPSPPSLRP